MKWGPLVGWGIVIYAIGLLTWVGLINWNIGEVAGARELVYLAVGITALIAARSLRFATRRDILPYSAFWVAEMILLDALYVVPKYGLAVYQDPGAWVVYGIVLLVPLLAPNFRRTYDLPAVS